MATTVTYKGQTLTTVDNATKVLETAGTWVEDDFTLVDVSGGGGGYTIDDIASTEPSGAITLTTPTVRKFAFYRNPYITSITTNGTTKITDSAFSYCTALTTANLAGVTQIVDSNGMSYCSNLTTLLIPDLVEISNQCFRNCKLTGTLKLQNLTSGSGNGSFGYNNLLTKVYFFKKININWQQNLFNGCTGITDIYVPWSNGEVSGAPWGASNATVHYDTVYDSNDEPIV